MAHVEQDEKVEMDLLNEEKKKQNEIPSDRGVWASKVEYLLSLIGYTVGLGSVWRFPYLCMKNGGGAFLIPFAFFMVLCGFPLYYLELCLGQFSGKSPLVVWNICPLFKGIGYTMVSVSLIVTWYYGTVMAWVLYYLGYSFSSTLPWSTCDNDWNTEKCVVFRTKNATLNSQNSSVVLMIANTTNITHFYPYGNSSIESVPVNVTDPVNGELLTTVTAATEFWKYKVLNVSDGIENWGVPQWQTIIFLCLGYVATFLCILKGVRSVGKVVWVSAIVPYVLLTVILVRSLTLEGALNGIIYYIRPDFAKLGHFQVWYEAALQVFYSLGPAWGGVLTMASFNRFRNKCFGDAVLCTTMDMFTAFYCGFVVFSIIGVLAHEAGMKVDEVVASGPDLVFMAYPEAIARLPLPQLWSVLFFSMLFFVGLDSQFGMIETVISGLADMYPNSLGKRKTLIILVTCIFYVILSIIFATQAGVYIFQVIDWYVSSYCIFLTSFLECIVIGWLYGVERFSRDIEIMTGRSVHLLLRWSWCVFTPLCMAVALLIGFSNVSKPVYNDYIYPDYIGVIGPLIGLVPVLPIPVLLIVQLVKTRGTFYQRLNHLIKPTVGWGPHDEEERVVYRMYHYKSNIWQKIKTNLFE